MAKGSQINRSNQMNPNNPSFWRARGLKGRPSDWKKRADPVKNGRKTDD